jgi:hypothetical protein
VANGSEVSIPKFQIPHPDAVSLLLVTTHLNRVVERLEKAKWISPELWKTQITI